MPLVRRARNLVGAGFGMRPASEPWMPATAAPARKRPHRPRSPGGRPVSGQCPLTPASVLSNAVSPRNVPAAERNDRGECLGPQLQAARPPVE
jgi:hypothetical protein